MGKYEFVGPAFEKTTEKERIQLCVQRLLEEFHEETEQINVKRHKKYEFVKKTCDRYDNVREAFLMSSLCLFGLDRAQEVKDGLRKPFDDDDAVNQ